MTLRRDLLAFTASAAAARTVLPLAARAEGVGASPTPDAELIEVCAEFDAWERRFLATDFEADSDTPAGQAAATEQQRCADAQESLVDRMCELRATTMEGHRARARSLALPDLELMKAESDDSSDCLTAAIVRDLIGEDGA